MHFSAQTHLGPMLTGETLVSLTEETGLTEAAVRLTDLAPDGRRWGLEPEAAIYPASMIKTPLAVAAARAVADGRAAWAERLTVDSSNMTPNDAPSPLTPGATATLGKIVTLMLSRSDNVATNMLFDRLDRRRASADIAALGFGETVFRRKLSGALPLIDDPAGSGRNAHPAAEACRLFERIAANALPDARRIMRALNAQFWNTKLSAGLAPGDRFAHKTGDTDEVSHDGGILTLASGERYALVVYTQLESNPETDLRFGSFMRALRPYLLRSA
jgi:beta-lactamase class A